MRLLILALMIPMIGSENARGDSFAHDLEELSGQPDARHDHAIVGHIAMAEQNVVRLDFEDFVLEIDSLEIWDEEGRLEKTQRDTAVVDLMLGETIEGRTVKISTNKGGMVRVFQRFETSITVMNEGPHCDLIAWKHYDSEWVELQIHNGEFLTDSYTEKQRETFIDVDMNELWTAVKNHCGEEWGEYVKQVKSPTEYPCGVGMSRIFLKVEFAKLSGETAREGIIAFEIPMGC